MKNNVKLIKPGVINIILDDINETMNTHKVNNSYSALNGYLNVNDISSALFCINFTYAPPNSTKRRRQRVSMIVMTQFLVTVLC